MPPALLTCLTFVIIVGFGDGHVQSDHEKHEIHAEGDHNHEGHGHVDGHKDHAHERHVHEEHSHMEHSPQHHIEEGHGHDERGHEGHHREEHGHEERRHTELGHGRHQRPHGYEGHGHTDHAQENHAHESQGHEEHGHMEHHGHAGRGHEGHRRQEHGHEEWLGHTQLFWAYTSALSMSVISFVGVVFLTLIGIPSLGMIVEYTTLFFAGTVLVADALIHLLPHALEHADHEAMEKVGLSAVAGCMAVLAIPEIMEWHHGHSHGSSRSVENHVQPYGVANLVTEMLHNFVDGISLGLAWATGIAPGLATTIAVAVHELPQEMGDFMVLRSAGFPVGRLLFWNCLASLTCTAGVAVVHILGETALAALVQRYMTAFTAGSFLCLALNMIFPQVSTSISKYHSGAAATRAKLLCLCLGILAVVALVKIGELEAGAHEHGHHEHGHHEHGHHEHGHHAHDKEL